MIAFPHAKINLGLQITEKRQDGYHNLASCFYPVGLTDVLEIIPAKQTAFSSSGLTIPGDPADNLCMKALHLLQNDYTIPPVAVHLHKVIPMGAGLGGGSSDGAFTLKLLNDMFGLSLAESGLKEYAAQLGSDCPFFIRREPMLATGTGTILHPADLSLAGTFIQVIYPGLHISTAEAYAGIQPGRQTGDLKEILARPESWKARLINDFENTVSENHQIIPTLVSKLYENGAWYAAMTGSGSAVFGLFNEKPTDTGAHDGYMNWLGVLD